MITKIKKLEKAIYHKSKTYKVMVDRGKTVQKKA